MATAKKVAPVIRAITCGTGGRKLGGQFASMELVTNEVDGKKVTKVAIRSYANTRIQFSGEKAKKNGNRLTLPVAESLQLIAALGGAAEFAKNAAEFCSDTADKFGQIQFAGDAGKKVAAKVAEFPAEF